MRVQYRVQLPLSQFCLHHRGAQLLGVGLRRFRRSLGGGLPGLHVQSV